MITTSIQVGAGDPVAITVDGVGNSASAGSKVLALSTSSDPRPVSAPFALTAVTAVTEPSVALSSTSSTATQVTVAAKFKSTNGLTRDRSTVRLTAPAGTVFPAATCDYTMADPRLSESQGCPNAALSSGSNSVTITTDINVGAGDPVDVTVNGVANSKTAGSKSLGLVTSSDPRSASQPFTLTPGTSVSGGLLALSSNSATASEATYTAKFKSTNGLTQSFSTVTLVATPGTVFPAASSCAYAIADPRLGQSQGCLNAAVSSGSNSVTITTNITVGAGDPVVLTVDGVDNSSSAGAKTLAIFSTSDPSSTAMPFTLSAPTRDRKVTPTLSSSGATASEVSYVVSYLATNGLTQNFSTMRLSAPTGTVFPSGACGVYAITDNTTGSSANCVNATVAAGSAGVTLTSAINVSAGDLVTVTANGVTNTSGAGTKQLTFSTSSDPVSVTAPFTLTTPTAEHGVTRSLSSSAATASEVTYSVSYVATNGLTQNFSRITLSAPAGTEFPGGACGVYTIADNTTGSTENCVTATVAAGSAGVTLMSGINVSAGDLVSVTANGVTNTSGAGTKQLTFSTTSDPVSVTAPFTLTTPTSEHGVTPSLSSNAATASEVTYSVSYVATNGLTQNFSRLTLSAPAGTGFPGGGCGVYTITDNTTGNSETCVTSTVSASSDGRDAFDRDRCLLGRRRDHYRQWRDEPSQCRNTDAHFLHELGPSFGQRPVHSHRSDV